MDCKELLTYKVPYSPKICFLKISQSWSLIKIFFTPTYSPWAYLTGKKKFFTIPSLLLTGESKVILCKLTILFCYREDKEAMLVWCWESVSSTEKVEKDGKLLSITLWNSSSLAALQLMMMSLWILENTNLLRKFVFSNGFEKFQN